MKGQDNVKLSDSAVIDVLTDEWQTVGEIVAKVPSRGDQTIRNRLRELTASGAIVEDRRKRHSGYQLFYRRKRQQ